MLAKQLPRASSIVEEFATSLLLQDSYRIKSSLRIDDTHRGYISQRTVLNYNKLLPRPGTRTGSRWAPELKWPPTSPVVHVHSTLFRTVPQLTLTVPSSTAAGAVPRGWASAGLNGSASACVVRRASAAFSAARHAIRWGHWGGASPAGSAAANGAWPWLQ